MGKDIYLIGICGTGVGALAGLLKAQGHRVRGSDVHAYPPMSDKLREWGIPVLEGFDAAHLTPKPDLVIIGNVVRASNPEAVAVRDQGIPHMSMPQAIAEFGIGDKHSIVIAGTHGKTTTSALAAHVLMHAGRDPGYLVGGALVGYSESFRAGRGGGFVIEGDEYDTAYFDKGPKFMHYRARSAVITSLEFDHADIFADIGAVEKAFAGLIRTVPADGHIIVWHGADRARRLIREGAKAKRITTYATRKTEGANLWLESFTSGPQGLTFKPVYDGKALGEMTVPLWGEFSAANVLAVIGALRDASLTPDELRAGFASFAGVRRRLELRAEPGGVAIVDDFAHHPTAVDVTLEAARTRWPRRRIWALFEPRSATSRRNVFQQEFVTAFAKADRVIIASHERLSEIAAGERFDPQQLAYDIMGKGVPARFIESVDTIADTVAAEAKAGDVVMVFSNGAFGGLHEKLIERLSK
ncbi:MAG: UDP-N-acetylmuramate--L-alanine ligase [Myxococcota bacterium]|nr:Mur ligase domain-containing protein [Myxococcota bacterium]